MHQQQRAQDMAAKIRSALEMFGVGESMMRQKLRRTFPAASEAEIDSKLREWLAQRPGAEHGDAPGKLRDFAG